MAVCTILSILDLSPADAAVGEVKDGKFFFSVEEPIKEGTMPTVAIAPGSSAYPTGYHAGEGGGLVAVDADFVAGNIKKDVAIFGVTGTAVGAYVLGTVKVYGSTTNVQRDNEAYGLMKDITVGDQVDSQAITTAFQLSRGIGGPIAVYGKVYKDGSPVGTERTTTSESHTWFTEDLVFDDGDGYEIWGKTSQSGVSVPCHIDHVEIRMKDPETGWAIIVE